MIFERPIIDRDDLLDVLDIIPSRAEATLRWMRRNSFVSDGLRVTPRRGNRLTGSAVVFSALNWDALRAARMTEWDLAQQLAAEASALERDSLAVHVRHLNDWSSRHVVDEEESGVVLDQPVWTPRRAGERWARHALQAAAEDGHELLDFVQSTNAATAAVRQRLADRLPPASVTLCRVWRLGASHTELRPLEDPPATAYSFLNEEIFSAGLRLGDAVNVRHEAIAPAVSVTTLDPAIELGRETRRRLTPRRLPAHLDQLLDDSPLAARASEPPPLRRVA